MQMLFQRFHFASFDRIQRSVSYQKGTKAKTILSLCCSLCCIIITDYQSTGRHRCFNGAGFVLRRICRQRKKGEINLPDEEPDKKSDKNSCILHKIIAFLYARVLYYSYYGILLFGLFSVSHFTTYLRRVIKE